MTIFSGVSLSMANHYVSKFFRCKARIPLIVESIFYRFYDFSSLSNERGSNIRVIFALVCV